MPGEHLHPSHIAQTLTRFGVPAQPARTATWRTLVRDAPPSVLADLLGVTASTAMRHAQAAGADYTAYAALKASGDHE
jgi:hypothetical protein